MNTLPYNDGRGLVPQSMSHLPKDCYPLTIEQAVKALPPTMWQAVKECCAIHGAGSNAALANIFGPASFAAASNFCIGDQHGQPMSLNLNICCIAAPLGGKSKAHRRFMAPVVEVMGRWQKRWLFGNVTLAALLRKIRDGGTLAMLSMAEARGYLRSPLSHSFPDLSDLYDGNVPSFDRADDKEDIGEDAPDSAVFVVCINVQNDAYRDWLDKHGKEAIASGYLFRLLMMETDELANEGAQQPESALLDYDRRIGELVTSGQERLETMSASELPVIEVSADAERILRQGQRQFEHMASAALSSRLATVFAVRLAANARRIAGCMHVFEGYKDAVLADTMDRAVTIAEFFGAQWLATVFPPKPVPDDIQRAQRLLDYLHELARSPWIPQTSWRKADIVGKAPNFKWTPAQMHDAIRLICGWGFAEIVTRVENGRRVVKLELRPYLAGNRPLYLG